MNCKEAEILSIPHIMGDFAPDSRRYRELEAHLASCPACNEEYEQNKRTIGFIHEHKALFAEALDAVEKKKADEQEEIRRSWEGIEAKLDLIEADQSKQRREFALIAIWKVAAAAACLAIVVSVWMAFSNDQTAEESVFQQKSPILASSVEIEVLADGGRVSILPGQQIRTSGDEVKTLTINGRHWLTMNADSTLSIEPFEQESGFGCMVKLASGEIFARVEHDSDPFVVNTPHGRAVITGTVFDLKAAGAISTLVVSEGTVRFESGKGSVEVKSGQISRIFSQSAPTKPAICNVSEQIAWARRNEIQTFLQKIRSLSDDYDVSELSLTAGSGRIDLEAIDYEDWIEKKQDWFGREFPWIFELQKALAKEGSEVDYPELLLKSGDIWQFVYPQASPGRIPVFNGDPLVKTASEYGFDKEWLGKKVQGARYEALEGRFAGLEAFEQWEADLGKASRVCAEGVDSGIVLCWLHSSAYLSSTRTLAWLGLKNRKIALGGGDRAKVLTLLESQVNTANKLTGRIIRLFAISDAPCEEYQTLIGSIIEDIGTITSIEKGILEYEGRK